MTEYEQNLLTAAGVKLKEGLDRFMGNEALFLRFLKKLPEDQNFSQIKPALDADDMEGALRAAHTLKGVAGNLSVGGLYDACSALVAFIREQKPEEAKASYGALEDAYEKICHALKELEGVG